MVVVRHFDHSGPWVGTQCLRQPLINLRLKLLKPSSPHQTKRRPLAEFDRRLVVRVDVEQAPGEGGRDLPQRDELAHVLGVHAREVRRFESGDRRLTASTLWMVAQFFAAPVSIFYEGYRTREAHE